MDDNKEWYDQKRYEAYIDERKLLIDAEREAARSFDKAVLTVASGSFAVSVAFLKDVVPNPAPHTLSALWVCWALFAGAILFILLSFLGSQYACREMTTRAATELIGNHPLIGLDEGARYEPITGVKYWSWGRVVGICNWVSVGAVVLAFIAWIYFVSNNLPARQPASSTHNRQEQPKGQK